MSRTTAIETRQRDKVCRGSATDPRPQARINTKGVVMSVGFAIAVIAGLHFLVGGLLYAQPLAELVREGVVASVPDFGDRAAAFWFMITAVPLMLLGLIVRDGERRGDPLPRALAPGLLVMSALMVIPMPVTGGWTLLPVAWLAWRRGRAQHALTR
jgi:hypothetical protein